MKGFGGGSSFEGLNLDGEGGQMKVLNRWEMFADNPDFYRQFDHPELFEYAEKIFGDMGVESLRSRALGS